MANRRYKQGKNRLEEAVLPQRIEDFVSSDNPVRAIEAFVETLDLAKLGFENTEPNKTTAGQPAFSPAYLLMLYLYGYINRIRSSRALERECQRNLEVIWLMRDLCPSYRTIADFRQRNAQALRDVHLQFITLCKSLKLLGGTRVAVDGSFFNGNVSDASFHSVKRLAEDIEKLKTRIDEWLKAFDKEDRDDMSVPCYDPDLPAKLEKLKTMQSLKETKETLLQSLKQADETQISETDSDARLLNKRGQTIAGYNVQIVVDAKHKLIVADDVVQDGNDLKQLHPMLSKAKENLGVEQLEGLADAGYCSIDQIAACEQDGITVYVPEPTRSGRQRQAGRFVKEQFSYDAQADAYTCPAGQLLHKSGKPQLQSGSTIQRYSCSETHCKNCPLRQSCITDKSSNRDVWRNQHEEILQRHRERMKNAPGISRKRSALVEHPFGTLKCRAGWTHFLVRGLKKVRGEWSLMALAYNFTRVLNLLGQQTFRDYCVQNAVV